jgi:hypothetical protein
MAKSETVTGRLIDDRTVSLDKPFPLQPMKVRIAIEPLDEKPRRSYRPEVIAQIHQSQIARGHRPPSREEVDLLLQSERDSWGN